MSEFLIETKQLTKIYGEQTAVNSVNLHVKKGRIYGLLGRNGAGKTTIMKMILGLTPITSGEVDVFGQNIKGKEKRIYPRIGAIIETPGFYPNLTGTENLEIFAKLRGTAAPNAVKTALEVVGLPYKDKKLFSKYSLGMKQRLGIANAILHDPELLILDEPTNGLDPIGIAEVRNFIKDLSTEHGKTILISSHILSEIELLADDIGIIDHGILLEESSMDELQRKNSKYILLQVSEVSKALLILERQFGVKDYSVQDEQTLRLYDTTLDMAAINKALVTQEVSVISWDTVQRIRQHRRRNQKQDEPGLFSGMLYCADCGSLLYLSRGVTVSREQERYCCSNYRKRTDSCSMHYIRAVVLEELILDNLKQTVKFATEHENEFAQCIMKRTLAKQQEGVKTLQKMLAAKEHRIKELDGIIKKLYEDNFSGKLSDERYMIFSREYEDEQHTLKSEVEELKSQIEEQTSKVVNINSFLTVAKKYTSFETLTPGMLHELIEKIVVHEGDKSSGHRIQKIDIYYSFVGDLETSHVVAQRTLKDRKAA